MRRPESLALGEEWETEKRGQETGLKESTDQMLERKNESVKGIVGKKRLKRSKKRRKAEGDKEIVRDRKVMR